MSTSPNRFARMRPRRHRLLRTLLVVWSAVGIGVTASGLAAATPPDEAPPTPFYLPPADLPGRPGTVVRTEPVDVLATAPTSDGTWPVDSQRVMFTSTKEDGSTAAVTGIFMDSEGPWNGPGERPTVVIAPGTTGQGDRCAISLAMPHGLYADLNGEPTFSANQEALSAAVWTSLGARVFVTDYVGLGTPGIHTYVNRVETGHAVLDAARAANALSGGDSDAPVLLWGYSQGGGATAAAAELQAAYAPDVNLKGVWAGAPVADIRATLDQVDGALIGGVIGFAVNGILDRHPNLQPYVDAAINERGQALLGAARTACIGDIILKHPFVDTREMTVDGRPLGAWLNEIPEAQPVLDDQRIGTVAPAAPVLITSGVNDDTVPYGQAAQLAQDWCGRGADVTFETNTLPPILPGATLPGHFGPLLIDAFGDDKVVPYLMSTLGDEPPSGCVMG
ncbi:MULTISPECIES: lipase family protein [Rhodococcus]|uniref:lipase family protein n=2 Tax=Rhodococcus TaxID=1827 RepID=UPI001CF8B0C3|nr:MULTISPECIES: lipase family protein [Rhodococcus]